MGTKLFVGNIHPGITEDELLENFATVGAVLTCDLMIDRITGRSRGFAFVEMETDELARQATKAMDGKELENKTISVKEARPRESRAREFRGGGGGKRNKRY